MTNLVLFWDKNTLNDIKTFKDKINNFLELKSRIIIFNNTPISNIEVTLQKIGINACFVDQIVYNNIYSDKLTNIKSILKFYKFNYRFAIFNKEEWSKENIKTHFIIESQSNSRLLKILNLNQEKLNKFLNQPITEPKQIDDTVIDKKGGFFAKW